MIEDLNKIYDTAEIAARKAAIVIMEFLCKAKISEKSVGNLVTEADVKAEAIIKNVIFQSFPKHSILGEEGGGEENMNASNLWIIDPLDGTNNYAHGLPMFCISIAYAEKGIVKAGIVFDPTRKELYSAIFQRGAFLNGDKIKVSENPLSKALISVGFYYDQENVVNTTLKTIEKLFSHNIHGIRRTGSAAIDICYVAAGRLDGYVEYRLNTWDFAAGMLILNEAGGVCKDAKGKPLDLTAKSIAVSNSVCKEEFLQIVCSPESPHI